jgi:hypothetical protein
LERFSFKWIQNPVCDEVVLLPFHAVRIDFAETHDDIYFRSR